MLFAVKCWIVRKFGGFSGYICGYLCGLKLGKNNYGYDTAGYIFNKIHEDIINKSQEKERELLRSNYKISLFKIIIDGFKADIETYKLVCKEIESNKSKWK